MDRLLLISQDFESRQLYHELLFTKSTEVIPIDDLTTSILLMSIQNYTIVILDGTHVPESEVAAFLRLRQLKTALQRTKIILISPTRDDFTGLLLSHDELILTAQEDQKHIAQTIQTLLANT